MHACQLPRTARRRSWAASSPSTLTLTAVRPASLQVRAMVASIARAPVVIVARIPAFAVADTISTQAGCR